MAARSIGLAVLTSVDTNEIIDELSHAFQMEKIKREVNTVDDVKMLRQMVLMLVDLNERQRAMFKNLLWKLIDENPEQSESFE